MSWGKSKNSPTLTVPQHGFWVQRFSTSGPARDTRSGVLRLHPPSAGSSAGILRLREELLARVNNAVKPVVVTDVLLKEMLVQ